MHIHPDDIPGISFDWGAIKWFVTPDTVPGTAVTQGEVIVNPGKGHARHRHPRSEELIYVVSGRGEQTVGDEGPFAITEGDLVRIPVNEEHSTYNTTWRPLRLIVTYAPGGSETDLEGAPDYRGLAAGDVPHWRQAD
ncbi:cupin domain-containing protein [Salinactinospora qingdaonensis]|uniref:Cupin domain-containing protein n=1 Tax=Salinactinospora qingdaonensis TaxID=702744 RepID=A0ABP7FG20_9ACTN